MARIYSYQSDILISNEDKLIGTDGAIDGENSTKNFTIGALKQFMFSDITDIDNLLSGNYVRLEPFDNEVAARILGDSTLLTSINTEATTRAAADTVLQNNINTEITSRQDGDSYLQVQLNTANTRITDNSDDLVIEEAARIAADATLQINIDNEAATRSSADTALQTNINTEATTRASADLYLQGNIDAEETARITADSNLQTQIDSNDTDISQLNTDLSTESTTRATADTTLQTNITAEATARISADAILQSQITASAGDITDLIAGKEDKLNKGAANGYASLDSGAKVPIAQLPDSVVGQVEYQGTWNASTNTPMLPTASGVKGHYYVTSVAGTYSSIDFEAGDWVISNGTDWEKVDNTDAVQTVFGRLGNILANESDYSGYYPLISDLTAETNARTSADTTLQSNIDTEATARVSADTTLQGNIDAEASSRISADNTLTASINTKQAQLNGTGFVKASGTSISYDNSVYLPTTLTSTNKLININNQDFEIYGIQSGVYNSGRIIVTNDYGAVGYQNSGVFSGLAVNRNTGLATFSNSGGVRVSNNLGIGVDPSTYKLDVNGDIRVKGAGNRLYFDTTGADASNGIKIINDYETVIFNDRGAAGFAVIGNSNIRLGFGTSYDASQTKLLINSSGNVGIGTTSPQAKLHSSASYSTYTDAGVVFYGGTTNSDTRSGISLISYGDALGGYVGSNFLMSGTTFSQTNTARASGYIQFLNSTTAGVTADIAFGGLVKGGTSLVERMRITSGGQLQVNGPNSSSTPLLNLTTSGTGSWQRGVRILNSGMNAGDSIMYAIGQSDGSRNMGQTYFYYAGPNSTSNRLSFGLHSVDDVMSITGNGNVGIGTTTPFSGAELDVYGDLVLGQQNWAIRSNNANADIGFEELLGSTFSDSNYRLYLKSGGYIGIGTVSPERKLHVSDGGYKLFGSVGFYTSYTSDGLYGSTSLPNFISANGYSGTYSRFGGEAGLVLGYADNGSGLYSPAYSFEVKSTDGRPVTGNVIRSIIVHDVDTNQEKLIIYNNGNIENTNNSYSGISDIRLKENIVDSTPKLESLMKVKIRNYNFIGDDLKQIGVIAQELEEIFPSMIHNDYKYDENGIIPNSETKSVKYSIFVPMLIKAMQEQQAQIQELKAELNALKTQLNL